jgi:GxxExxY protein
MESAIIEKELSYRIVKSAFEVQNQLGPGFLETIYDEAMALQLVLDGMDIERQKRIPVKFKNRVIGQHVLDGIVNQKVILEYKAVAAIAPIHEQQALSYLKATGFQLAIVINFGASRVEYSRVVNTPLETAQPCASYHANKIVICSYSLI